MVELLGHLAMGLLFALPAWILWDGRTATAFVALVLATTKLPDLDLLLGDAGLPVKHHGVTHTVVFVVGFAVVVGLVATAVFRPLLRRWWRLSEGEDVRRGTIALFVVGGLALGGLSHLVGDMISSDGAEPVEPLWPLLETEIEIGLANYASPWLNAALLLVAGLLHLALIATEVFPVEHRFRHWRAELIPDGGRS